MRFRLPKIAIQEGSAHPSLRRLCGNPDGRAHPGTHTTPETSQVSLSRRGASIFAVTEILGDALSVVALFAFVWVVMDFPRIIRFLAGALL